MELKDNEKIMKEIANKKVSEIVDNYVKEDNVNYLGIELLNNEGELKYPTYYLILKVLSISKKDNEVILPIIQNYLTSIGINIEGFNNEYSRYTVKESKVIRGRATSTYQLFEEEFYKKLYSYDKESHECKNNLYNLMNLELTPQKYKGLEITTYEIEQMELETIEAKKFLLYTLLFDEDLYKVTLNRLSYVDITNNYTKELLITLFKTYNKIMLEVVKLLNIMSLEEIKKDNIIIEIQRNFLNSLSKIQDLNQIYLNNYTEGLDKFKEKQIKEITNKLDKTTDLFNRALTEIEYVIEI